ncbi:MAG: LptF/LptG family permease [Verrucomicrobiota bacterium]
MKLLDRYVLRNFLEPLLLCFGGFLGLWLIYDFSANSGDLFKGGASLKQIGVFYLYQLPQILMISLPAGILLALLFCCYKMSRSNEIISILTAGRSLPRILLPLFGVGVLASLLCLGLNYEWAPRADAAKKALLEELKDPAHTKRYGQLKGHLFRDRTTDRTWFIRKMTIDSPILEGLLVLQQDKSGIIQRKWYANRAIHDPVTGRWTLQRGMIIDVSPEGEVLKVDNFEEQGQRVIEGWTESPRRIVAANLDPQQLTVPELQETIELNPDLPEAQLAQYKTILGDRWAFPWGCLVVVFIAAPLGIVYSRRGSLSGTGLAFLFFFLMMIGRNLCLALGKGGRIAPELAAWLPQASFMSLGLILLWFKAGNRSLSTLFGSKR